MGTMETLFPELFQNLNTHDQASNECLELLSTRFDQMALEMDTQRTELAQEQTRLNEKNLDILNASVEKTMAQHQARARETLDEALRQNRQSQTTQLEQVNAQCQNLFQQMREVMETQSTDLKAQLSQQREFLIHRMKEMLEHEHDQTEAYLSAQLKSIKTELWAEIQSSSLQKPEHEDDHSQVIGIMDKLLAEQQDQVVKVQHELQVIQRHVEEQFKIDEMKRKWSVYDAKLEDLSFGLHMVSLALDSPENAEPDPPTTVAMDSNVENHVDLTSISINAKEPPDATVLRTESTETKGEESPAREVEILDRSEERSVTVVVPVAPVPTVEEQALVIEKGQELDDTKSSDPPVRIEPILTPTNVIMIHEREKIETTDTPALVPNHPLDNTDQETETDEKKRFGTHNTYTPSEGQVEEESPQKPVGILPKTSNDTESRNIIKRTSDEATTTTLSRRSTVSNINMSTSSVKAPHTSALDNQNGRQTSSSRSDSAPVKNAVSTRDTPNVPQKGNSEPHSSMDNQRQQDTLLSSAVVSTRQRRMSNPALRKKWMSVSKKIQMFGRLRRNGVMIKRPGVSISDRITQIEMRQGQLDSLIRQANEQCSKLDQQNQLFQAQIESIDSAIDSKCSTQLLMDSIHHQTQMNSTFSQCFPTLSSPSSLQEQEQHVQDQISCFLKKFFQEARDRLHLDIDPREVSSSSSHTCIWKNDTTFLSLWKDLQSPSVNWNEKLGTCTLLIQHLLRPESSTTLLVEREKPNRQWMVRQVSDVASCLTCLKAFQWYVSQESNNDQVDVLEELKDQRKTLEQLTLGEHEFTESQVAGIQTQLSRLDTSVELIKRRNDTWFPVLEQSVKTLSRSSSRQAQELSTQLLGLVNSTSQDKLGLDENIAQLQAELGDRMSQAQVQYLVDRELALVARDNTNDDDTDNSLLSLDLAQLKMNLGQKTDRAQVQQMILRRLRDTDTKVGPSEATITTVKCMTCQRPTRMNPHVSEKRESKTSSTHSKPYVPFSSSSRRHVDRHVQMVMKRSRMNQQPH